MEKHETNVIIRNAECSKAHSTSTRKLLILISNVSDQNSRLSLIVSTLLCVWDALTKRIANKR